MKKIYEDGADRPQIEDISSGAFDFTDADPLPQKRETPPSPIRTNNPDAPQKAVDAEPTVQMTQEQLEQLLQKVLASKEQQPAAAPDAPAEEPAPDNALGTRILYQSKDFNKDENAIDQPSPQKKTLSSFLEADDSFDTVDYSDRRFQVDEVYDPDADAPEDDELPPLPFASRRVLPKSGIAVEELSEDEDEDEAEEQAPLEPDEPGRHVGRMVVLVISILAILVSVGVLLREYKLHLDNKKFEENVSDMILQTAASPDGQNGVGNNLELTEEQQWEQIRGEFPNVSFPRGLQLKYARLYGTNREFAGYLEAPGINMSLPVVRSVDDEAYLNKNFYGKSTKYGCPFMSCLNQIEPLDYNTVIFGHHMNDRTIFGALDQYKTLAGYKQCPVIAFNTMYHDYNWKVFAVFITNSVAEDDNGYVFPYYFTALSSDEKKTSYISELKQRSIYDTGVDVRPGDKLLTLSTCSHEFDNARLVVVARMVREGERAEVDTSNVTLNTSARYPQVYYDKKKISNPYVGAACWTVG